MPALRGRGGAEPQLPGGVKGYPIDKLLEEVAFIAYHFKWENGEIMRMPHWERTMWCEEISKINKKLSQADEGNRIAL